MEYKKMRSCRTSDEQRSLYVAFLQKNPNFLLNKIYKDTQYVQSKWEELSYLLNACETGAHHTISEWKTVFRNWKCDTKKKARIIKKQSNFGERKISKPLSAVEKKYIALITEINLMGNSELSINGSSTNGDTNAGDGTAMSPINVDDYIEIEDVDENSVSVESCSKRTKRRRTYSSDSSEDSVKNSKYDSDPTEDFMKKSTSSHEIISIMGYHMSKLTEAVTALTSTTNKLIEHSTAHKHLKEELLKSKIELIKLQSEKLRKT